MADDPRASPTLDHERAATPDRPLLPRRRDDLHVHEVEGEAFVYDPQSADTHRLNQSAFFIWQRLDGTMDEHQLVGQVLDTYDLDEIAAVEHVHRILLDFNDRGLLAPVNREVSQCGSGTISEPRREEADLGNAGETAP